MVKNWIKNLFQTLNYHQSEWLRSNLPREDFKTRYNPSRDRILLEFTMISMMVMLLLSSILISVVNGNNQLRYGIAIARNANRTIIEPIKHIESFSVKKRGHDIKIDSDVRDRINFKNSQHHHSHHQELRKQKNHPEIDRSTNVNNRKSIESIPNYLAINLDPNGNISSSASSSLSKMAMVNNDDDLVTSNELIINHAFNNETKTKIREKQSKKRSKMKRQKQQKISPIISKATTVLKTINRGISDSRIKSSIKSERSSSTTTATTTPKLSRTMPMNRKNRMKSTIPQHEIDRKEGNEKSIDRSFNPRSRYLSSKLTLSSIMNPFEKHSRVKKFLSISKNSSDKNIHLDRDQKRLRRRNSWQRFHNANNVDYYDEDDDRVRFGKNGNFHDENDHQNEHYHRQRLEPHQQKIKTNKIFHQKHFFFDEGKRFCDNIVCEFDENCIEKPELGVAECSKNSIRKSKDKQSSDFYDIESQIESEELGHNSDWFNDELDDSRKRIDEDNDSTSRSDDFDDSNDDSYKDDEDDDGEENETNLKVGNKASNFKRIRNFQNFKLKFDHKNEKNLLMNEKNSPSPHGINRSGKIIKCPSCPFSHGQMICGTDNVTYSSMCRIEFHNCIHESRVRFACFGFCPCSQAYHRKFYRPGIIKEDDEKNSIKKQFVKESLMNFVMLHDKQNKSEAESINEKLKQYHYFVEENLQANGVGGQNHSPNGSTPSQSSATSSPSSSICSMEELRSMGLRLLDWFLVVMKEELKRQRQTSIPGSDNRNVATKNFRSNRISGVSTSFLTSDKSKFPKIDQIDHNNSSWTMKTTANKEIFNRITRTNFNGNDSLGRKTTFPECEEQVSFMFNHFDHDHNHQLSSEELYYLEHDENERCLQPYLYECDEDQNDFLSVNEWCSCFNLRSKPCFFRRKQLTSSSSMMMTKAKMGPIDDEFIPQCDSNGQFHNVQCHEAIDACWCSDKNGNEIAGTRIKGMHHKPKCDKSYPLNFKRYPSVVMRKPIDLDEDFRNFLNTAKKDAFQGGSRITSSKFFLDHNQNHQSIEINERDDLKPPFSSSISYSKKEDIGLLQKRENLLEKNHDESNEDESDEDENLFDDEKNDDRNEYRKNHTEDYDQIDDDEGDDEDNDGRDFDSDQGSGFEPF